MAAQKITIKELIELATNHIKDRIADGAEPGRVNICIDASGVSFGTVHHYKKPFEIEEFVSAVKSAGGRIVD